MAHSIRMKVIRTNSTNENFISLVQLLDRELAIMDGDDHEFYHQFNHIDTINHVVVIFDEDRPIACGGIKAYNDQSTEIKRMYTHSDYRGRGMASLVLKELEKWAAELSFQTCILETGMKQKSAIALYSKNGYVVIENYGQYAGIENSICFEKIIKDKK